MQKLMVREKTGEEKNRIAILMDPERFGSKEEEYLPSENKVIESVLALTLYYLEKGISVDVVYYTDHIYSKTVESTGDFETLYDIMCKFRFREELSTERLLIEWMEGGAFYAYRQVIGVMQKWTAELQDLIDRGNTDRVPYKVIRIRKSSKNGNTEDRYENGVITIGCEDLLEEVL